MNSFYMYYKECIAPTSEGVLEKNLLNLFTWNENGRFSVDLLISKNVSTLYVYRNY